MASTPQATPVDGAQKIAIIFSPMLDATKKELKEHQSVSSQEILLEIQKLGTKIELLEKLVGEKKKPVARGEKKPDAGAGAEAGAETPIAQPTGAQKNFAVNKLVYFREQFKTNADYRAKYVNAELQALMDKDPSISGKAEPQRLIAQATFCWNYFKTNKTDIAEAIEKEYIAAKQAHEAAVKPPQQVAEAHTPEKTD